MCKVVEDFAKEYAKGVEEQALIKGKLEGRLEGEIERSVAIVRSMLKDDIPLETALKYAQIDKATYDKYAGQLQ